MLTVSNYFSKSCEVIVFPNLFIKMSKLKYREVK